MATNNVADTNHQQLESETHEEDPSEVIEPLEEQEDSKTVKNLRKGGEETSHAPSSSREAPYRKIYRSLSARLPKSASRKKEESKPKDGAFFSRLALALQRKAVNLTSHHKQNKLSFTKSSHEAVEKPSTSKEAAKSEVRLREKRIRKPRPVSFGEEIPVGKEVIRFIDDSGSEISSEIDLYQYITVRKWDNVESDSGRDDTDKKISSDKEVIEPSHILQTASNKEVTHDTKTPVIELSHILQTASNKEVTYDTKTPVTEPSHILQTASDKEVTHETKAQVTEPSNILQTASDKKVTHETKAQVTEPSHILQTASDKEVTHETKAQVTESSHILQTASDKEVTHETKAQVTEPSHIIQTASDKEVTHETKAQVTESSHILQTASDKKITHETKTPVTEPSHILQTASDKEVTHETKTPVMTPSRIILPKLSIRTSFKDKFFKPLFKRKSSQTDDIFLGTEPHKQGVMTANETLSTLPKTSSDSCLKKNLNVSEHFIKMGNWLKPWKTKEGQSKIELTFPKKKAQKKTQRKPEKSISLKDAVETDSRSYNEGSEVSSRHRYLSSSAQMTSEERDSSYFDTSYSKFYEVIENLEKSENKKTVEKYPFLSESASDEKNGLDIEYVSEEVKDNALFEKYVTANNFQENVRPDNIKREIYITSADERKLAQEGTETVVVKKMEENKAKDVEETMVMEESAEDKKEARGVKETIVTKKLIEEGKETKGVKETIVMEELTEEDKGVRDNKDTTIMEELTEEDEGARDDKDTIVMEELTEEDKGARDDKDTIVTKKLIEEGKETKGVKETIVMEELTGEDEGARDDENIVMEELTEENKRARDNKDTIVMEELTKEDKGARDYKDTIVMEELTEEDKGTRDDKDTIVMEELTEEDKKTRDDKDTIVMEELTEEDKGTRDDKDTIVMEELTEEDKGARDDKDTIVMEELTEEDKGARDDKDNNFMDKLTEEEAINWKYIMLRDNLVEKELSEELKHIQHDQWIRRTYFLPKSSKPGVPPRSKRPKACQYGQSSVEVKGKIQSNRTTRSASPVDKVTRSVSPELTTRKPVSFISNMERSMNHFSKPERSTSPLFNTERTLSSYKMERTPSPISRKDNEDPGSLILSDVKPVRPLRRFSPQVNLDEHITAQAEVSTPSGPITHLSEVTSYDELINSENRNLVKNCKESLPSIDSSPKLAHKEVLEEKQKSVSFEEEVKWKTYETANEKEQPHTVIWPFSLKSPYLEKFQKFSTSLLKPSAFSHSSSKKKTPPQRPPPPKIKQKDAAVQYEANESQQSQDGSLTMEPKLDVKLLSVESENIQKNVIIEDEVTSYPDVEAFPIDEGKELLSHDFGRNETSNSSTQERKEVDEKEDKDIDLKTSSENKNKVENVSTTSMSVSKCSKPQRPPPPDYSYLKNKISPSSQISPKSMEQNLFQETKSFSSTVFQTGRQPKPPPRTKRQRSKTVEISKEVWKRDEAKVTRSQSFDKHDIKKHNGSEETTSVSDLKSLYTQVQKGPSSVKFCSNVEAGKEPNEYPKIKFGVLRPPPPRYKPKLPLSQDENGQNIDPTQTGDKYSSGLKEVGVREHAGIATSGELPFAQYASEENQVEDKTKLSESNLTSAEHKMCELHLEKLKLTDSSCDTRKNMSSKNCKQFEETGDNIQVPAGKESITEDNNIKIPAGKESITGDNNIQIPARKESFHRKKSKLQSPNAERTGSYLVEEDSQKKLCDESCFPECTKEVKNICCEDSGDGVNNTLCISDSKFTSSFAHKQYNASQLFPAVSETKGQDAKTDDLLYPYPDYKEKSINKKKVEHKDSSDSNKLDEDFKKKLKCILEEHAQKVQKGVEKYKNVSGERRKDKFTYQQDNKPTIKTSPELSSCDVEMREAKQKSSGLKFRSWQEDDSSEESGNEILSLSPNIDTEEKKKSKVFCIAQKIVGSEKAFVDNLRLLNEVFRRVVEEAGKEWGMSLIPDVSLNEILKYFPQLQNLNEKLLRELEERIEHWPENGRISDIFVTLGPFLKLYTSYFRDLDYTTTLINVCRIKYPVFDYVVKEFETSSCCQTLSLYNYMLKPVQRISQYCLLLQEYLNHLQASSSDYEDTVAALQIMSQVASETIKHEDNISKLISIQNSLCGHHEVIRPGRMFIKEGDLMKLSRKIMKPRRFILFNDSLWYMKQVQYNLYRVKQEFPLVGMKVSIPIQQDYENEFNIISMTKSFILCASSPEERSEWINVLNKAIEENACKHSPIINAKKYEDVTVDLGSKAPELTPDSAVTSCQLCTNEFSVNFHRHHCQACEKVVCSACSTNGAPLSYLGFKTARVCDECFPKLQKEDSQSKYRYSSRGGDSGSRELESDLPLTSEISEELVQSGCRTKKNVPSCVQEICDSNQVTSISGHLWKKGRRGWKQYWFVIDDKVLYMYKTNEDLAALASIPLLNYSVETVTEATDGVDKNLLFQLNHPALPPVLFHADKPSSAKRWIRALTEASHLE